MKKRYCFDTSAFSTPLEQMPVEIHRRFWANVVSFLELGEFAMTEEVFDEAAVIKAPIGSTIASVKRDVIYRLGETHWDSAAFAHHFDHCRIEYRQFIHEYNGLKKAQTVGLTDVGIVCLAKTMSLPLVSSEVPLKGPSPKKLKIPDLCGKLKVEHLTFNEFLIAESITDE